MRAKLAKTLRVSVVLLLGQGIASRLKLAPLTLVLGAALGGCVVGPDFKSPGAPPVSGYLPTGQLQTSLASGGARTQRLARGRDVPGEWWALFGSTQLDGLIRRGIEHNADVKAQEAAIRAAHANWQAQRGALFPTLSANYDFTRQKVATESQSSNAASGASIYSVHTAQLSAGFVPDVFGGTRRMIEAAGAQVSIEELRREAIVLTMTASMALAAIQEASLRGQIGATRRLIAIQTQNLGLLRRQETAGQISLADVTAQETSLAQTRLLLPPLERQLGQQRNFIAVLAGSFPSESKAPRFTLSAFSLPGTLPLSLPADLVRQRPDILISESSVRVANAQVGVAIANRLPQIKISGNAGSAASALSKLFAPGTGFWLIAADVVQPIFDGFSLHYKQKAAEHQLVQAMEQYRSVVLVAFQNVADALLALQADAKALAAAIEAERSATRNLDLLRRQLEEGQISLPSLLTAQQAVLQTSLARVQAEASRLADTVVLFQALGGGWWNREIQVAGSNKTVH
jgi:NodT family efflux transporter outer membrane factor (OMF) lipoprotein